MAGAPPPGYVAYPRETLDPDRLKSLADGFFGLNTVFIVNVVMVVALNLAVRSVEEKDQLGIQLAGSAAVGIIVAFLTFKPNARIANGLGWPSYSALLASLLMGLNSALCCGLIGYIVMQQFALGGIKKYGIKAGFFGLKKKDVEERIAELRQQNSPPPA
ncbi:MAG: hypothetical protein KIT11_03230 [Fimbriimonadaceae bacterium]|nr:hypothetical protein [Fimbriimonadaceae bacterium]QYK57090.1 MAG: hypothetical protein KF733_06295 [Fimbriimonadaceae bacterium]